MPLAVAEMVESLADRPVAAELAAVLARETGGNSFFVREVVLHLPNWPAGLVPGHLDLPQGVVT